MLSKILVWRMKRSWDTQEVVSTDLTSEFMSLRKGLYSHLTKQILVLGCFAVLRTRKFRNPWRAFSSAHRLQWQNKDQGSPQTPLATFRTRAIPSPLTSALKTTIIKKKGLLVVDLGMSGMSNILMETLKTGCLDGCGALFSLQRVERGWESQACTIQPGPRDRCQAVWMESEADGYIFNTFVLGWAGEVYNEPETSLGF